LNFDIGFCFFRRKKFEIFLKLKDKNGAGQALFCGCLSCTIFGVRYKIVY